MNDSLVHRSGATNKPTNLNRDHPLPPINIAIATSSHGKLIGFIFPPKNEANLEVVLL